MTRRRLLLGSYSDEDENDEVPHHQPPPNPNNNSHTSPLNRVPPIVNVPSSPEEEFIDVPDNLTPPSPPEVPVVPEPPAAETYYSCPVGDFLSIMGLRLKREWLESCLSGTEGFSDVPAKAKLCFEKFLVSDMNYSGAGVLPPNVDSLHLVDLPGPFVLQVDEIVNISCPLKGRYQEAPAGVKRCLKLSMTDGVQRVFGMEYRPIKDLKALAPAGLKVVICNVHIRHGLLMLVPEALEVLGGMAEELDAARQRLVNEVNKPPRGRRCVLRLSHRDYAEIKALASRATLAAWPPNGVTVSGNRSNSLDMLGHASSPTASVSVLGHTGNSVSGLQHTLSSVNISGRTGSCAVRDAAPLLADAEGAYLVTPGTDIYQRTPTSAESTMANSSATASDVEMHRDPPLVSQENAAPNQDSHAMVDNGVVEMIDEIEHPLVLSGEQEIPFTYLASLSTKWAAMNEEAPSVQGKVKCFLTGVKGFQYKQRTTYELLVYIDDGSLILEILIDHNVVQKGIGYTPKEVTSALSSSDAKRVSDMKEKLKQFQIFLVNFEGSMLVEMNRTSPVPVALEMNQGCPASDAWLLMRRLKSLPPAQTPVHPP